MKHVLALFLFFTASVALAQDEDRPPTPTEAPETAENPVPAEGEGAPDAVVKLKRLHRQRLNQQRLQLRKKQLRIQRMTAPERLFIEAGYSNYRDE